VLESEVRLRWAMAYAHAGYDDEAQRQLNVWKGHAPFIGNAALHALHRAALGMIDRQHPPGFREGPEAPSPAAGVAADTVAIVDSEGWDAHEARLLEKLFERAMTRAGGNEAVARRILQLTPTRFDRLKAIHREAQEKKKSQE
jgi:hypothetical protein